MPTEWPSLADQLDVAAELYDDAGRGMVAAWLDEQIAFVDDAGWAAEFASHTDLPGIAAGDYAHRLITTARGSLLGGIRFYGTDIQRPFTDVLAHNFTDLDALVEVVAAEWTAFGVRFLRLRAKPGGITGESVIVDQTIHAARYRDMCADDGRVRLAPVPDAGDVLRLVGRRYADRAEEPELAHNVAAQSDDRLVELHGDGHLQGIWLGNSLIGVLAVAPGEIGWISGDEVQEEVVVSAHNGCGYAASAQAAWAAHVADDRDRLMIGTIARLNVASRRSAVRAGRPVVLTDVFVRCGELPSRAATANS